MSAVTITGGTSIEWADYTFNPWWGCERVSPACAHCYADTLAKRRQPGKQLWGAGHEFRFFGDAHWADPLRWARVASAKLGRRPRVFCASMADVFEERPELEEHRERLFALIHDTPELDWLVLTKRPAFAYETYARGAWTDWPNVWVGVSIENSRFTWRADVLREIPAAVRFISAEPLLGSLCGVITPRHGTVFTKGNGWVRENRSLDLAGIDWVIVGGESGPKSRPFRIEHARELLRECETHSVAVFVKQLGRHPYEGSNKLSLRDAKGGNPDEWPEDLRIREFPTTAIERRAA